MRVVEIRVDLYRFVEVRFGRIVPALAAEGFDALFEFSQSGGRNRGVEFDSAKIELARLAGLAGVVADEMYNDLVRSVRRFAQPEKNRGDVEAGVHHLDGVAAQAGVEAE